MACRFLLGNAAAALSTSRYRRRTFARLEAITATAPRLARLETRRSRRAASRALYVEATIRRESVKGAADRAKTLLTAPIVAVDARQARLKLLVGQAAGLGVELTRKEEEARSAAAGARCCDDSTAPGGRREAHCCCCLAAAACMRATRTPEMRRRLACVNFFVLCCILSYDGPSTVVLARRPTLSRRDSASNCVARWRLAAS